MPENQDGEKLPEEMARSLAAFSRVMALLPGNVTNQPFNGPLAAMELARVCLTVTRSGGGLVRTDGVNVTPLTEVLLAPEQGGITLDGVGVAVGWVVFQRLPLLAFDHILAGLTPQTGGATEQVWVICADRSPLLEAEGMRLVSSHLKRMGPSGRGEDLRRELEGICAMLRQGNPFGGGEEEA